MNVRLLSPCTSLVIGRMLAVLWRRQGDLERWDSMTSRWQRAHLVMTRAGFLHIFPPDSAAAREAAGRPGSADGGGSSSGGNGAADGGGDGAAASGEQLWWGGASSWTAPQESLNLSRCSFEPGERAVAQFFKGYLGFLGQCSTFPHAAPTLSPFPFPSCHCR